MTVQDGRPLSAPTASRSATGHSGEAAPAAGADHDSLARCAAGDVGQFEMLYRRHAGRCLVHARAVLVDSRLAEDAVQEAFLDLWRHAGRFDGSRSTVASWLLMLTHRKAVDRVRSEQRRSTSVLKPDDDARPDEQPGPDVAALTALFGADARRAVESLSEVKREVLVLAYWGGYTQVEIAVITGAPLGTVKSRTLTALRELRPVLEKSGWDRGA